MRNKPHNSELIVPATKIPVVTEADVIVVGGGPAGFGAAVRAAQQGVDTLLIEKYSIPGGNPTTGFVLMGWEDKGGLHTEWNARMRNEGYLFDSYEKYPKLIGYKLNVSAGRYNFSPDEAASVFMQMMEEANVRFLFRTLFVDTINTKSMNVQGEASIEAIIVQNESGRQAIRGKVFIDATGRGDVVARAGAPFIQSGINESGSKVTEGPTPGALSCIITGINETSLSAYLPQDPKLQIKIASAKAAGDIPDDLYWPIPKGIPGSGYYSHVEPEGSLLQSDGAMRLTQNWPPQWKLHPEESAQDANRAEIEMRRRIFIEWKFLKKYVPGFENSRIAAIAPNIGYRERRHPVGEYMLTYKDLSSNRKFPDTVLINNAVDPFSFEEPKRRIEVEVPYRCFIAKKLNNLLLAGECLSFTRECYANVLRRIPWSIMTGEVAGSAAAMSVKQGIFPKELKWTTGPMHRHVW